MKAVLRTVVVGIGCAGLIGTLAGSAAAQEDPPGNNGTVKIDGVVFDDHPDNEPHVGCVFQVDFYGFDQGDLEATVLFEAIPPTAGDAVAPGSGQELLTDVVFIGGDAAGGGTDLDASRTYDLTDELSGIEPHPEQGWHVRLTVHAEGSQGADTKFKVFWVRGCGPTTTTSSTTSSTTSTSTPGSSSTSSSTTSTTDGDGSTTTTEGDGTTTSRPGGIRPSGPGAPGAPGDSGVGAGNLPLTGSGTLPMVVAALVLILLGAGLVALRRLRLN